jgi:hypothetical protein
VTDPNKPKNGSDAPPVKESMEKLDAIAQDVVNISAKQELKRRIIRAAKQDIAAYYDKYPERALDERGHDNQELNIKFVQDIIRIVDDYVIARTEEDCPPASK